MSIITYESIISECNNNTSRIEEVHRWMREDNAFAKKAVAQDKDNKFKPWNGTINLDMPRELEVFYLVTNPIDVKVKMYNNPFIFHPANELIELQKEFELSKNKIVFATCNGDPIYISGHAIYTHNHWTSESEDHLLSGTLSSFLDLIN